MPGEYNEFKQVDYEIHREEVRKYGWRGRPRPPRRKKILHALYWLSPVIFILAYSLIFFFEFGILSGLALFVGSFFVLFGIPFSLCFLAKRTSNEFAGMIFLLIFFVIPVIGGIISAFL